MPPEDEDIWEELRELTELEKLRLALAEKDSMRRRLDYLEHQYQGLKKILIRIQGELDRNSSPRRDYHQNYNVNNADVTPNQWVKWVNEAESAIRREAGR